MEARPATRGLDLEIPMAEVDEVAPVANLRPATVDRILGAIEESKTTPQWEIGQVPAELGLLGADHQKLGDRVQLTETTFTELTPAHQDIKAHS
ncbi:hypothetical protein NDU88_002699 [Pleurodeles waltl]|uniref:Uncharacterized protein n=1 Tax=Pleurodeles waltl TaxID=8319 RepID=A0AAV7T4C8_PLEWA|nr:hypothetical protein NDU88_002699 [Pleurodeles waltl]